MPCFLVLDLFVKKETVTGIMGNTHGVTNAINPPKNPKKKTPQAPLSSLELLALAPQASAGALRAVSGNKILNWFPFCPFAKGIVMGNSIT